MQILPQLSICLSSKYTVIRYLAARCIGIMSTLEIDTVLTFVVNSIVPKLTNNNMDATYLQGPIETIYRKYKLI